MADGTKTVKQLAEHIGISSPRVSQHIKALREAGHEVVVKRRYAKAKRDGTVRFDG